MDLSLISFTAKVESHTMDGDQEGDIVMETKPAPPLPLSPPSTATALGDQKTRLFGHDAEPEAVVMNPKVAVAAASKSVRYRECMRNHAASIGGHASDGCGEFMPGDVTKDSLSCAACGCHRNFHRRELDGDRDRVGPHHHHHRRGHRVVHSPPLSYNAGPATPRWDHKLALPSVAVAAPLQAHASTSPRRPHHMLQQQQRNNSMSAMISAVNLRDQAEMRCERTRSETPEREVGSSAKRFRTKFTQEQKERMLEYAERIGWRIPRQDDVALAAFCADVGVKRNVLKVWMHNNKSALRRRDAPSPVAAVAAAPSAPPPQAAGV